MKEPIPKNSRMFFLSWGIIFVLVLNPMFIVSSSASGQTNNVLVNCLKKINSIKSGRIKYRYKFKAFFSEDTLSYDAYLDFFRLSNEKGQTAILLKIMNNDIVIYDLQKTYRFSVPTKSKRITDYYDLGDEKSRFLYNPVLQQDPILTSFIDAENIRFSDTAINHHSYQVLRQVTQIKGDDNSEERNSMIYYFNQSDSLPIHYYHIYEKFADSQYEEYELINSEYNIYDSSSFFSRLKTTVDTFTREYEFHNFESNQKKELNKNTLGMEAPNFNLKDLDGHYFTLDSFSQKGKIVMVEFWYNSCFPCRKAIPQLVSIYDKFHEKGLEIVGINPFDTNNHVTMKTINSFKIPYTILIGNKKIAKTYNVTGYPSFFLLDKQKRIIFSQTGYSEDEMQLSNLLAKLLE